MLCVNLVLIMWWLVSVWRFIIHNYWMAREVCRYFSWMIRESRKKLKLLLLFVTANANWYMSKVSWLISFARGWKKQRRKKLTNFLQLTTYLLVHNLRLINKEIRWLKSSEKTIWKWFCLRLANFVYEFRVSAMHFLIKTLQILVVYMEMCVSSKWAKVFLLFSEWIWKYFHALKRGCGTQSKFFEYGKFYSKSCDCFRWEFFFVLIKYEFHFSIFLCSGSLIQLVFPHFFSFSTL